MNVNQKLQKINKNLQEVARKMEIGGTANQMRHVRAVKTDLLDAVVHCHSEIEKLKDQGMSFGKQEEKQLKLLLETYIDILEDFDVKRNFDKIFN